MVQKYAKDICPWTLSGPRSEWFSERGALPEENCELLGTYNVRGQISEHIFTPYGDYRVSRPSNLLRNRRNFEN